MSSLQAFIEYTHPNWQTAAHHHRIFEHLEAIERGDLSRLIVTAPPRHGKSEVCSRRFPSWFLGRNPSKQVISCSYNGDLAADIGRDVRNIAQDDLYGHVFGDLVAADSSSSTRWHTREGGVYIGAGIGGTVTGRGAHIGVIDDPVKNREEAESAKVRESVWNWYTSTFYTRLMPGASIVVVMTRWHDDDLGGRLLQQKGWELLELPALSPSGEALWPQWYPAETLKQIRGVIGPRDWAALYMQRPVTDGGDYFQRAWFKRYDTLPEGLRYYITHDFAVSADQTADYTEIAVWGIDADSNVFAVDWWSGQELLDVTVAAMFDLIRAYRPMMVIGEKGVIRKAMEPYIRQQSRERTIFGRFEWVNRTADKPAMAKGFQALASMGRVHFPMTAWADRVIEQLVRFDSGEHDDAVDACAHLGLALDSLIKGGKPRTLPEPEVDAWGRRVREVEDWRTS